jgi:hypothetical protein
VAQPPEIGTPVAFSLPKRKPRVIEKEEVPYQHKYAVVPFPALADARLHHLSARVLALICAYANRAGITWVGQARIAGHLNITKQAVNKAVKQLKEVGYIQVMRRGFRGTKADTIRIVFDPSISAEEAISITSGIEDTRPPDMTKRDKEIMAIMADNDRQDITPEELERNRKRLNELVGTLVNTGSFRHHQPQKLGEKIMPRRAAARKKPVNPQVDHEGEKEGLHSQPMVNLEVDRTMKTIGIDKVLKTYVDIRKDKVITDICLRWVNLAVEVGITEEELKAAIARSTNLGEACKLVLDAKGC